MPFPKKSSYSPEEEQSSINEWCLKLIRMPEEHILVCRNWQRATVEHFVRRSFGIEFNETSHGSCTLHVVWVCPFDPKTLLEEIMNFFYPKCCDDPFARSLIAPNAFKADDSSNVVLRHFFFLCSLSIQSHTECFSDCSAVVARQAKAQTVCNCKWHDCTRKCGTFPFGIELKFIMFVPIDLSNLCIFDFWNAQGKQQMKNARVRNVRALEEEKRNRPLFLEADI